MCPEPGDTTAKTTADRDRAERVTPSTKRGASADGINGPRALAVKAWASSTGLKCTVCNEKGSDWRSLWEHMQTHDPAPEDSAVFKDSSGLLHCLLCGYRTRWVGNMRRHFTTHTSRRVFQCNVCQKRYKGTPSLLAHLVRSHGQGESTVYKCDECDYSTTRKHLIRPHKRSAHSGTGRCEVCFKQIKNIRLQDHYFLHTEEKPHSCKVCGKKFIHRRTLRLHIESSHLKVHYKCNVCGKSFKRSYHVARHSKMAHTKESSHICCVCSKPFSCHSEYVNHVAGVHIGERNEKCPVCGKGFFRKSQLLTHLRAHTGERPFSCNVCGKAFSHKASVESHMTTHFEERTFKCYFCGIVFKWKHNLASHIRARHA